MNLRYALLCEYACPGAHGKPTVVGIYEAIYARADRPLKTSPSFIHCLIDAPTAAGPHHTMTHRLIDGDGDVVFSEDNPVTFHPKTINPSGQFCYNYAFVPPIDLPGIGDYEWVLMIDGNRIGSVPFALAHAPASFIPPQS